MKMKYELFYSMQIFSIGIVLSSFLFSSNGWAASQDVVEGSRLFMEETFNGSGVTCNTCHRPERAYTIDSAFISGLPTGDTIFLHETDPNIMGRENDVLARELAIFTVEPDSTSPIRSPNHLAGLAEPQGWGGDKTLESVTTGAIEQHATATLNRIPDVDFRLPDATETTQLSAFMNFISGVLNPANSSTFRDTLANQGRAVFNSNTTGKCLRCHVNGTALNATGVNLTLNTGAESLSPAITLLTGETLPTDTGDGAGQFNVPPIFADTGPFFHNNGAVDIEAAVAFYVSTGFSNSPSGIANGGIALTATQQSNLARFLREDAAVKRIISALSFLTEAQLNDGAQNIWLRSAMGATDGALRVLSEKALVAAAQTSLTAAKTGITAILGGGTDFSSVVTNLNSAQSQLINTFTPRPRPRPRPR